MLTPHLLQPLGWQTYFQQQVSLDEWGVVVAARVIEQHRSQLVLDTGEGTGECTVEGTGQDTLHIDITPSMPAVVVGDWVLLNDDRSFNRLLLRKSTFARKAAGSEVKEQLISANVDTAFIVTSANHDFNLNRIERFLAMANEAGAEPVLVITKADLSDDVPSLIQQAQSLDVSLSVRAVNALDEQANDELAPWLGAGETVVLLGSSGVGKSTLANTLMGEVVQSTGGIREDDSKGRHTTTSRALISLPQGALLLDTPGMRELQLSNVEEGIHETFADIEKLALACKFNDCTHASEPNCAVQIAIGNGDLTERRLKNYQKLLRENSLNSASLAERRAADKSLAKFYKATLSGAEKFKGRYTRA